MGSREVRVLFVGRGIISVERGFALAVAVVGGSRPCGSCRTCWWKITRKKLLAGWACSWRSFVGVQRLRGEGVAGKKLGGSRPGGVQARGGHMREKVNVVPVTAVLNSLLLRSAPSNSVLPSIVLNDLPHAQLFLKPFLPSKNYGRT